MNSFAFVLSVCRQSRMSILSLIKFQSLFPFFVLSLRGSLKERNVDVEFDWRKKKS